MLPAKNPFVVSLSNHEWITLRMAHRLRHAQDRLRQAQGERQLVPIQEIKGVCPVKKPLFGYCP
jgi:hypothetical protein